MDPITGIGLAASVVQLVQFGISAAEICLQIYRQGFTSENIDADYVAGQLASLTSSLQQSLYHSRTKSDALSKEEKDLVDLGRKCEDCANKLQYELRKLRARPQASALETARIAARSILKKSSIMKIQEQLGTYTKTLETSLLCRLSKRFDVQSLSANERFIDLDQSLKHIITCLARSQTDLSTLVVQESEQTRQSITAGFDRLVQLHINERLYQDVIRSLFYPDITSRQAQIEKEFDGIEDSYNWVFDEFQQKQRWSNFSEWLRSGNAVYWINGKAGSGKSTLMNYICNHNRKDELLKQWSAERRLLTPTFFFWNAGTRQQKTVDGLLRSIIYQMLEECSELIACFKNEPLHSWNETRLLNEFVTLLTQEKIPLAICMFIDGLDEFDGRYNAVIEAVNSLANQAHVKICLSSRPLLDFEKAFADKPGLRLQDMTSDSINAYAHGQLMDLIQQRFSSDSNNQEKANDLLHKIVRRAEGVFLWVVIAIRDVRDGLQDFADLHELARAIEELPAGVDSLYIKMLDRIKPAYRREAARLIQIVLCQQFPVPNSSSLDLYKLYFIDSQRVVEDLPLAYDGIDAHEIVKACHDLKTRLLSHTVGLLDLTPSEEIDESNLRKENYPYFGKENYDQIGFTKVQVHHRTVRDFLLHNAAAKVFMANTGILEQHLRLSIARGTFAHLVYFSQKDGEPLERFSFMFSVYLPLQYVMLQVSIIEELVGAAQAKFMRSLHAYSFIPKHRITADTKLQGQSSTLDLFVTHRLREGLIDLIGMAAHFGVVRYVCEVLDLPLVEPASFYGLRELHANDGTVVQSLSWVPPTNHQLHPSGYHKQLNEHLKWKRNDQVAEQTEIQVDSNALAETYLLACCHPLNMQINPAANLTFVRVLLKAGANPMVQVKPAEGLFGLADFPYRSCFWGKWLDFLMFLTWKDSKFLSARLNSVNYIGPLLDPLLRTLFGIHCSTHLDHNDHRVTLDDIWKTTKALIAQGANINFRYMIDLSNQPTFNFAQFQVKMYNIEFSCSAMFWLEDLFNGFPEFQDFAAAIESKVMRPSRKIVCIVYPSKQYNHSQEPARAYLNNEESEMLWPFIEKWEKTLYHDDFDVLQSALRQVWRAHKPNIKLPGESEEDTDEELDEELNEEVNKR